MSKKSFKCYRCGKVFQSVVEPKKYANESGFLGHICNACFNDFKKELENSLVCPKCNFPLKNVKTHTIEEMDMNNEIWTYFKFQCPSCKSHVTLKRKLGEGPLEINLAMLEPYTDASIKKVYNLYQKGYNIIGKGFEFDKTNSIYTISLAKGNDLINLNFSNFSKDFSRFWAEIQFVYDNNFRRIATLIEPNEYWGRIIEPKKIKDFFVKISGFIFNKVEILDLPEKKSKNPLFRFILSLKELENKNFLKVDFREPLVCYLNDEIIFSGYIATIMKRYKSLEVICHGMLGDIMFDKINIAIKSKKKRFLEVLAFLLDYFEKAYQISGLDTELRNFEILIPIFGINLSDKLKLGDCYIIEKPPNNEFLFRSNFPTDKNYAFLNIKRKSFFDAFTDGLRYIDAAINLINYRIKIPSFLNYYHHIDQRVNVHTGDIIYIIDKKYDTELAINLPLNQKPEFEQKFLIKEFFRLIQEMANKIIKPNEELSNENEKLLWIFHFLISAESKTNRTEAFLDLCIALEFALSRFGIKIEKKFRKEEIKNIRRFCNNFEVENKEDLEKALKENKVSVENFQNQMKRYKLIQKRLNKLIDSSFNQPSLNDQLTSLLENYNLELSDEEFNIFKSARKKRNEIIHGKKKVKPTNEEYNIISKIIYFLLRNALIEESLRDIMDS